MYRDISDPWGCQKGAMSLNNRIFTEMVFDGRNFEKRMLDVDLVVSQITFSSVTGVVNLSRVTSRQRLFKKQVPCFLT
jgi:hypothetical protein